MWIGVIGVLPNVLNEDSSISVVVLLSGAERFCAMAFHILLTLVIMEGIRRHKKLFYWLIAVVLHGLYDFSIAFQNTILIWGVLIFGVVAAMIALILQNESGKKKGEQDNEKEYEKTGSGIRRFRDGSGKSDGMQLSGKRRK